MTNTSGGSKNINLFSFVEFCLWNAQDDMLNYQRNLNTGEVEIDGNTIYHKTEYREMCIRDSDNPDVVIRGNEYGETKSYIGSAKTLIAFDDMAANPDTDVVSGRIWQGKNPYWFTGVQYSTEFGIVKSITGSSMIIQTLSLIHI